MDKKTITKFKSFLNSRGAGTMYFGFYKEYRNTNRMVLVFGKGFDYNVREYSADTKIVQHKSLGEYMKKYVDVEFDPNKAYFIKIAQRMFNKTHTQYAVVLSTRFTTKDNA